MSCCSCLSWSLIYYSSYWSILFSRLNISSFHFPVLFVSHIVHACAIILIQDSPYWQACKGKDALPWSIQIFLIESLVRQVELGHSIDYWYIHVHESYHDFCFALIALLWLCVCLIFHSFVHSFILVILDQSQLTSGRVFGITNHASCGLFPIDYFCLL